MNEFRDNIAPAKRQQIDAVVVAGFKAMVETAAAFDMKLLSDDNAATLEGAMIAYMKESTGWEANDDIVATIFESMGDELSSLLDGADRAFAIKQLNQGVDRHVVAERLHTWANDYKNQTVVDGAETHAGRGPVHAEPGPATEDEGEAPLDGFVDQSETAAD